MPPTTAQLDSTTAKFIQKNFGNAIIHIIDIRPDSSAAINECFPNVNSKICRDGGELVVGWSVSKTENLIEAEFHGVWRSPDGLLLDITPPIINVNQTIFIEVKDLKYEGMQKDNIREKISSNPLVNDLIIVCEALFRLSNFGVRKFQKGIVRFSGPDAVNFKALTSAKIQLLTMIKAKKGKNSPCYCGGGKKYKHCCGIAISEANTLYRNDAPPL